MDQESGSYETEFEGEHRWTARDREVVARTEQHLNKSESIKVDIEELESLLGPEDLGVNLRQILWSRKGGRILEIFNSNGHSEHFGCQQNAMG